MPEPIYSPVKFLYTKHRRSAINCRVATSNALSQEVVMSLVPYPDIASLPEEVRTAIAQAPVQLNIFKMMANAETNTPTARPICW